MMGMVLGLAGLGLLLATAKRSPGSANVPGRWVVDGVFSAANVKDTLEATVNVASLLSDDTLTAVWRPVVKDGKVKFRLELAGAEPIPLGLVSLPGNIMVSVTGVRPLTAAEDELKPGDVERDGVVYRSNSAV